MRTIPWPHSPAIIARVEIIGGFGQCNGTYYEVRYAGRVSEVADHAAAERTAEDLKAVAAAEYWSARPVLGFGGHDQMGVT